MGNLPTSPASRAWSSTIKYRVMYKNIKEEFKAIMNQDSEFVARLDKIVEVSG